MLMNILGTKVTFSSEAMDVRIIFSKVCTSEIGIASLLIMFQGDTCLHSWEVLAKILESEDTQGILCDIGM